MTRTNHTVILISSVYMRTACVHVWVCNCLCVRAFVCGVSHLVIWKSYSSRYNAESTQETMMVYGKVAVGATDPIIPLQQGITSSSYSPLKPSTRISDSQSSHEKESFVLRPSPRIFRKAPPPQSISQHSLFLITLEILLISWKSALVKVRRIQ